MNEQKEYQIRFTPEKEVELLVQLAAGILARKPDSTYEDALHLGGDVLAEIVRAVQIDVRVHPERFELGPTT